MSAAEPAIPRPDLNTPTGAAVIDLNRQRPKRRRALDEAQGRWGTMSSTDGLSDEASEALRRYAETIEKTFLKYEQSLTRPETATSFQVTLAVLERALQGHHAQGVIDDVQLGQLVETINDLRKVPGLL